MSGEQLAPGTVVGPYRVEALLGRGGMGEVYLAEEPELGRRVALKLLPSHADDEGLRRFQKEARAASALNHPNILTVFSAGEAAGRRYIATELVAGVTLRQRLAAGALPVEEALEICRQAAAALAAAHQAGIVHRDIKPENLMVRPDGLVKVLDFGLATAIAGEGAGAGEVVARSETRHGVAVGTLSYMAPEQMRGEPVDARADVYALGVVLYELLAGANPLTRSSLVEAVEAVQWGLPPLGEVRPDLPVFVQELVARATARQTRDRFGSAEPLLRALATAAAAEPTERLRPPAPPPPPGRGGRSPSPPAVLGRRRRRAMAAAAALALAIAAAGWWLAGDRSTISSLAVMPLAHPPDVELEAFSDGLTEGLIRDLARLPGLEVIARTSVFRYKGRELDPPAVRRELGIEAMLTGAVERWGDDLRVSVELVDLRRQRHLWGASLERPEAAISGVREEIARRVAERLGAPPDRARAAGARPPPTPDPEAHRSYLRGRLFSNRRTGADLQRAVELLGEAVARDPTYAHAWAGLADAYALLGVYNVWPPDRAFPAADEAARRALELDQELAEAHTTRALVLADFHWRREEALERYRRALVLDPSYATARQWYAEQLSLLGRHDEALKEIAIAQRTDPLSPIVQAIEGWFLFLAGRYPGAVAHCRRVLREEPGFYVAHVYLGRALEALGQHREAVATLEQARGLDEDPWGIAALGHAYASAGDPTSARRVLDELDELAGRRHVSATHRAAVRLGLGELDDALELLEAAVAAREQGVVLLAVDPWYAPLRDHPRFQELLRRVGLERRAPGGLSRSATVRASPAA